MPRRARDYWPRRAASGEVERLWGIHPVREALRAGRRELLRLRIEKGSARSEVEEIVAAARDAEVPIEEVSASQLAAGLEPGSALQGVVLEAGALPELTLEALADSGAAPRTLVALDGVEDPQNVGAIARVAAPNPPIVHLIKRLLLPPGLAAVDNSLKQRHHLIQIVWET